ncbi:type 4a pilus biogenesis protein PilO [bacterium]|nr:type 4a pilus biogenesis protein PilO [bacterium]
MKYNILSKMSKRERITGVIAVLVLLFFGVNTYVVKPLLNKMDDLDQKILMVEKKLRKAYGILFRENTIAKEYEEKLQFVKQDQNEEEEIAAFLSAIETIASSSNIFLSDIKPGNVEKTKNYRIYSAEIEIESEISYIVDFMYQLERLPQLIKIKSFTFSPKDKNSNELKGNLTMVLLLIDES